MLSTQTAVNTSDTDKQLDQEVGHVAPLKAYTRASRSLVAMTRGVLS
jgi:hypothetical protein